MTSDGLRLCSAELALVEWAQMCLVDQRYYRSSKSHKSVRHLVWWDKHGQDNRRPRPQTTGGWQTISGVVVEIGASTDWLLGRECWRHTVVIHCQTSVQSLCLEDRSGFNLERYYNGII